MQQSFHCLRSSSGTALVLATTLAVSQQISHAQQAQSGRAAPTTLQTAAPNGQEWLAYGLDPGERRYSPLTQIDASNVAQLEQQWTFDIPGGSSNPPGGGNQEATLLMSNGVLYGITTWSVVYAVDARTGKQLWKWDPEVNRPAVQTKICCGVVNRGVALYEGKVIAPIIDGRLVALDAASGRPVWEARVEYPQNQYTLTMAPRIAKGKVIVGASGSEYPVRGFVDAFDASTGQRVWRFYTVPGDPTKPFENEAMRKAAPTWSGEWYKMGGGATVWDGMAYDPDVNLLYFGTGNGGPWPEVLRGSQGKDNLYVCSIIAVNPDNGEMKWYYQAVPGDSWDYDAVAQLTLADISVGGARRRVIMQANKNGYFYVIDRITGEFITATPYAPMNWSEAMDKKTGRPFIHPRAFYGTEPVTIFPGPIGAHNWAPMSFNPETGLMYIPTTFGNSSTYTVNPKAFEYKEGGRNTGIGRGNAPEPPAGADAHPGTTPVATPSTPFVPPMVGPQDGARGGFLLAWDPVTQKERWRKEGGGASGGGTLTTAGNLVLQVLPDGRLIVYSADKGDKLHEINTGLRLGMGPPITYMLDGKQYVALTGGRGTVVAPPGAPAAAAGTGGAAAGAGPATPAADTTPVPPRLMVFALGSSAK
jgi:PQQ-dependent dehydrogenase (methanol/ethanol family)